MSVSQGLLGAVFAGMAGLSGALLAMAVREGDKIDAGWCGMSLGIFLFVMWRATRS